ncbi:MAG: hypothetical protein WC685_01530 [Methylobacter sp.]
MSDPSTNQPNSTTPFEMTPPIQDPVPVLEGRPPTPSEAALLEYGKQLMLKSVETALDFHKTMLGVSATFGTLVTSLTPILIWGEKDAKLPMPEGWLLIIPPILMLLSSIVFAFGYYPRHAALNINVVDEIQRARDEVITSRKRLAGIGLGLFSVALLLTVVLTLALRRGVV